jgi:hypothetical protein
MMFYYIYTQIKMLNLSQPVFCVFVVQVFLVQVTRTGMNGEEILTSLDVSM